MDYRLGTETLKPFPCTRSHFSHILPPFFRLDSKSSYPILDLALFFIPRNLFQTKFFSMLPHSLSNLSDFFTLNQTKLLPKHTLHSSTYLATVYKTYISGSTPAYPPPPPIMMLLLAFMRQWIKSFNASIISLINYW